MPLNEPARAAIADLRASGVADLSPDEVMAFYSGTYPELTTSTCHGPKVEGDKAVYEFKTVVGTKG